MFYLFFFRVCADGRLQEVEYTNRFGSWFHGRLMVSVELELKVVE